MAKAINPLLAPSPLPFGFPDFAAIREEHFRGGLRGRDGRAARRDRRDHRRPGPPTFDDTVVALERSGATLRRVSAVFFVLVGSCTPGHPRDRGPVAPLLAAHADAITLDPALFARLDALHAARAELGLDPESLRCWNAATATRSGPARASSPAAQERLRALNAELSALSTEFGARLLAETNAAAVLVDDPARLDGLSPDAVSAAARAAESRGLDGHLLPLVLPTRPARARLAHRPGAAGAAVPGVGLARAAGHRNDTRDVVRRSPRCVPSGRGCSATRTTRRG